MKENIVEIMKLSIITIHFNSCDDPQKNIFAGVEFAS